LEKVRAGKIRKLEKVKGQERQESVEKVKGRERQESVEKVKGEEK
jgi:hypothetical protein